MLVSLITEAVYDRVRRSGAAGLTDEEISATLRLSKDNASRCRLELVKMGDVCDSGIRRQTILGRSARVWMATDVARKVRA